MGEQRVIRTYPPAPGYRDDQTGLRGLEEMLRSGYRVVTVNRVGRGGCEWLEYIVEKEETGIEKNR